MCTALRDIPESETATYLLSRRARTQALRGSGRGTTQPQKLPPPLPSHALVRVARTFANRVTDGHEHLVIRISRQIYASPLRLLCCPSLANDLIRTLSSLPTGARCS